MKTYVHTKTCIWMLLGALFLIVPKWKQPKCPPTGERIKKNGTAIQWNIIGQQKGIAYQYMVWTLNTCEVKEMSYKDLVLCDAISMNVQDRQIYKFRIQISGCLELGPTGRYGGAMMANGHRLLFRAMKCFKVRLW